MSSPWPTTLPSALTADSRQPPTLLSANRRRAHYRRSPIVLIEATLTMPFPLLYKSRGLVTLSGRFSLQLHRPAVMPTVSGVNTQLCHSLNKLWQKTSRRK
ncbi:uncharacterized protein V6R79_019501 [Siganus canaliculatus]